MISYSQVFSINSVDSWFLIFVKMINLGSCISYRNNRCQSLCSGYWVRW